jgi:8-oxo-dGTP diphosphatase
MKRVRQYIAAKAFINHNGKILIIREATIYKGGTNIGKYDVVGGKIKPGEQFEKALLREIKEETGLTKIKLGEPFYIGEWRPIIKGKQIQIIGIYFECFSKDVMVKLLKDYDNFRWINPESYDKYKLIDNVKNAFTVYLNKK